MSIIDGNILDKIDISFFNSGDRDDIVTNFSKFRCDNCSKILSIPHYFYPARSFESLSSLDFCHECFPTIDLHRFFDIKEIDRQEVSEKEKPKTWPCYFCRKLLGGGDKWIIVHIKNEEYYIKDICADCFSNDDDIKKIFISMPHEHCVRFRDYPVVMDISSLPASYDTYFCKIPENIKQKINNDSLQKWKDLIHSVVSFPSPEIIGSIKQWILLYDLEEESEYQESSAGILYNFVTDKIASVVCDDHGRVSVDIIMANLDKEYELWEKDQYKKQPFPVYLREKYNLSFYYG